MTIHKFAVGEIVLFTEMRFPQLVWKAPYTVIARITSSAVEMRYRIRSILSHETRLASERELSHSPMPQRASRSWHRRHDDGRGPQEAANLNLLPVEQPSPLEREKPLTGGA